MSTVQLPLTDEETDVVQLIRGFVGDHSPVSKNSSTSGSINRASWTELASLGFFEASAPSLGNQQSLRVLGLFAHTAGRELLNGPWLEHILASRLLATLKTPAASAAADRLGTGAQIISLPLLADDWSRGLTLVDSSGTTLASGQIAILWHSEELDGWLLPAWQDGSCELVWVPSSSARSIRAIGGTQGLWPCATVSFETAPVHTLGRVDPHVIEDHLLDVAVLLAMFAIGAVERLLEMALAHMLAREQFGRPIGSFQALKHRAANIFIELEHVQHLTLAAASQTSDREKLVFAAKIATDKLFREAAEATLQIYGGLGFTMEVPIHHYLARSLRHRLLPRPTHEHRRLLGTRLGLE